MEVQWQKHVRVICDLKVGDKVRTDNWGPALDGVDHFVEEIKSHFGKCDSGFMVKISGYNRLIDSNWLNKVEK